MILPEDSGITPEVAREQTRKLTHDLKERLEQFQQYTGLEVRGIDFKAVQVQTASGEFNRIVEVTPLVVVNPWAKG